MLTTFHISLTAPWHRQQKKAPTKINYLEAKEKKMLYPNPSRSVPLDNHSLALVLPPLIPPPLLSSINPPSAWSAH
jgi:hypothetical protein